MAKPATHAYKEKIAAELGELPILSNPDYRKRFTKGFKYTHCVRGHELTDNNVYTGNQGKYRRCKACSRIRSKHYQRFKYQENPEEFARKRHEYDLKWKYGISIEEKNAMLEKQGYRCANKGCLTDKPMAARNEDNWLVDHDHKTGKVRGLLCNTCNLTLGALTDDIGKLQGLIDYLKEHSNG